MIKSLRKQIAELPPKDQLEQALYLLDEISGNPETSYMWLKKTYNLTATEALVFCTLNARSPNMVSKEALFAVFNNDKIGERIVDVYICKIRKKVDVEILTLWGTGYCMPKKIEIPQEKVILFRHNQSKPWSQQDDEDLATMISSGSCLSAIAEELGRTERGVNDRKLKRGLQ